MILPAYEKDAVKWGQDQGRTSLKENPLSLLAHCKDFPFTNTRIIEAA